MFTRGLAVLGLVLGAHSALAQNPDTLAAEVERYRHACDGGDMTGCFNLANMYRRGRGVPMNDTLAGRFFRRACDGGDMQGCGALGGMYVDGRSVVKNDTLANQLFRRARDGGEMMLGCVNLGFQYRAGRGVPQNDTLALQLFRRACDGGDPLGCALVPRMSPRPKPPE